MWRDTIHRPFSQPEVAPKSVAPKATPSPEMKATRDGGSPALIVDEKSQNAQTAKDTKPEVAPKEQPKKVVSVQQKGAQPPESKK